MIRRSQESVSFMIIIGVAVLLFLLFSGIISQDNETAMRLQDLSDIRSINELVATAVYRSVMSGPGTIENITLKQLSTNYTVMIIPGSTVIIHESGINTHPTKAFMVYESNITSGQVQVSNEEGCINVSQV